MGQLLVIGYSQESTISHFVSHLDKHKVAYDFLDLSLLNELAYFDVHYQAGALQIGWNERIYDFKNYDGFFNRCYVTETYDPILNQFLLELVTAVSNYLEHGDAFVINRPSGGGSNANKFIHLQKLAMCGFEVPKTYIVGSSSAASRQLKQHKSLVSKSISGVKTESVKIDSALMKRIGLIDQCPTCLQELIAGVDVRVHSVGEEMIALQIETDSEHIDYRFTKTKKVAYNEIKVPKAIQEACLMYCEKYNLIFCGFDFKVNGNSWTVLEANPMPGYDYFDDKLDNKISEALVNYLSQEKSKESVEITSKKEIAFIERNRRPKLPKVL